LGKWQHARIRVLRGIITGFSKEARMLRFAALTLVRFAFVE
jgi:hypothetical protein